ncbi:MAG: TonB family protein, partial [Deltaproteobacteria bacterium]|nr:TonB family protein [Deltaproteobacteria bacterium]
GGGAGKEEAPFIKKSTGLPQTTIEQQKNSTLEQPQAPKVEKMVKPKPEMAPKDQVVVKDKKDLKTQTIQKPKEVVEKRTDVKAGPKDTRIQDALAKINNDLNERKALPEAAQVKNVGEGSPTGSPGGSNSECASYSSRVRQRIVGNWIRIVGSNKPPRPPKISITINGSGQVTSSQYLQKSGDLSLDNSALRAIQNSSPLPPPPANCDSALRDGMIIQFGR